MGRINIELPDHFNFHCFIPIRITDVNYGNHVGNDTILSLIHEARMQFLKSLGYTEINMEGTGMIMSDVSIVFKKELYYGDIIMVSVAATQFSRAAFTLVYKIERQGENKPAAIAETGMICYDYENKKIVSVPEKARTNLKSI